MFILRTLAVVVLTAAAFSGCVVEERTRPYPPCRGAFWVEGHYGPRGGWHHGHWRCPGVVEVVEVD
jgi:hypothetical protein